MRLLFAVLRLAAAIVAATAIVVTVELAVAAGRFEFFTLFGFFTIQGNLICAVVFLVTAIAGFTRRRQGRVLV